MTANAGHGRRARLITTGMAGRANGLDIEVMLGAVSARMIVFVATLASCPHVPAIGARQHVWVRATTSAHLDVDPLTRLLLVTVARRHRRWTGAARLGVHACHGPLV